MKAYQLTLHCIFRYAWTLIILMGSFTIQAQMDSLMNLLIKNTEDEALIQLINNELQSTLYQAPAEVLQHATKVDSLLTSSDNLYAKAETKNSLGLSLYVNQRFDEAIGQLLSSMRMFEQIKRQDKIARLSNSLAIVYQVRKEHETSAAYWEEALSIYESLGDSLWIANVAANLGGHYMEHDQLEEASMLFDKACPIFEALGRQGLLGYAKLNQGSLRVKQKRFVEAIESFDLTFELISYNSNPLIHAVAYTGRGNAYLELENLRQAKEDLQKGYDISKELSQYEQLVPASELLSRYYEEIGDYKKSLSYFKENAVLQDSFLTAEEDARLVDALKKYETEKKEQEISLLSAENEIKDCLLYTSPSPRD